MARNMPLHHTKIITCASAWSEMAPRQPTQSHHVGKSDGDSQVEKSLCSYFYINHGICQPPFPRSEIQLYLFSLRESHFQICYQTLCRSTPNQTLFWNGGWLHKTNAQKQWRPIATVNRGSLYTLSIRLCCFVFLCWLAFYLMDRKKVRHVILLLVLGQLTSLFLGVTSFTSSLIADLGVDTPLTQTLFTYLSLALVYSSILLYRREKLRVPWYWYIGLGFVDVQGNYLVIKAFQFSSITSVTLLDCWAIPWAIILTWIFIGTRYSLWQFFGAAMCIVGLGLVLLSDAGVSGGGGTKPLLGDTLVIVGALFYAISNVGEEFCVKKKDRVEVVAMLGVFGVVISICEILVFERKNVEDVKWSATIISLFAGYATSTFLFYTVAPFVLKMSGAAIFNLSLLTSDMWAVLIRIFFYHQQVDWLYYLSFCIVVLGLIIYSLSEPSPAPAIATSDEEGNLPYQPLIEEPVEARSDALPNS